MREEFLHLLNTVRNPFLQDRVDSAWDLVLVDVEAINRTAFEQSLRSIRNVHNESQSRGLVLHGETGSGKTHLLQRLRRRVQREATGWFIYVPLLTHPDRFFRHLLACLVNDLIRGSHEQQGLSQIELIVGRQLMDQPGASLEEVAAWWQGVQTEHPPGSALFTFLEEPLEALVFRLQLDPEVITVLRHYLARHHRFEAYTWLLGKAMQEEAVNRISAADTLDDEDRAKWAIVTFSRLAGHRFAIVLAFDQLEGLQIDPSDRYGLRAYANGVVTLITECRNLAPISCVQTYFLQVLREAIHEAHYHRLAQDQAALTLLNREMAMELVARRLEASEDLQQIRTMLQEQDRVWPLQREQIEALVPSGGVPSGGVPSGGISARMLLRDCREMFEKRRRELTGTRPPPPPPPSGLRECWEAVFEEELQRPQPKLDEGVYADGLLRLLDIIQRPGSQGERSNIRDVDLLIQRGPERIGVAVCHAEHMTSLAARLKRLIEIIQRDQVTRLLLIRDERLPISPTATVTQERLRQLQEAGHRLIRPPAEAYAALAVARRLLAEAAAGDLTVDDRTVVPDELKRWLAENLPIPLRDFLDDVLGDQVEREKEPLERLQEHLKGWWILRVTDVTRELGFSEQEVSSIAARNPQVMGYLAGPPSLVFVHPEGVERV